MFGTLPLETEPYFGDPPDFSSKLVQLFAFLLNFWKFDVRLRMNCNNLREPLAKAKVKASPPGKW